MACILINFSIISYFYKGKKEEQFTDPDLAENQDETHIDVDPNHEEETSEEYISNFNFTKEINSKKVLFCDFKHTKCHSYQ